jgi:hypothetical protein
VFVTGTLDCHGESGVALALPELAAANTSATATAIRLMFRPPLDGTIVVLPGGHHNQRLGRTTFATNPALAA